MKGFFDDINDDQIRIVGGDKPKPNNNHRKIKIILLILVFIVIICCGIYLFLFNRNNCKNINDSDKFIPTIFEPIKENKQVENVQQWLTPVDTLNGGYIDIRDTLINDILMKIYIPRSAEMTLHIGRMDKNDTTIIYAAQAADIRADNGEIVGAFVLKGEPKSLGLSKKGYCASIDGKVYIGVADNSPLFEEATSKGGYFFRQYPLVDNRKLVDNQIKGKSIRRGICDSQGRIFMVETTTRESFHDFSQALIDLGVDNAIYLVGSSAYGWAVDKDGNSHEFGKDIYADNPYKTPKNISYIVWRKK